MALGRVREHRTFRALRRAGRRGRSGPVAVIALVDGDGSTGDRAAVRAAFAVGRRVGPAVVRNRVRRRLRAIVGGLDLAPGAYLVTASPEAATTSYDDLHRHVGTAAAQAMAGDSA
jgi:ribonuclease P protein component